MKQGKLLVFSAPSGSGKTTLVRHLLQQDLPLGFSISATSRVPRGKEEEGKDYYFLSPEAFEEKINTGAFLEYEEVYAGTYYGTLKTEVERLWQNDLHVLFDIDVVGGLNIKKQFPEQTLALFVQPPSFEILEKRLRARATETEEKIQMRLDKVQTELNYAPQFDYCLINDDLDTAKKEVVRVVREFLNS